MSLWKRLRKMLMSLETTTKQRSTGAAGGNGLHDRDVVESGGWVCACERIRSLFLPLWPTVWSGRSQTPSCSLCLPPSGLSGRGSSPDAIAWCRSRGQGWSWVFGSASCLDYWLSWACSLHRDKGGRVGEISQRAKNLHAALCVLNAINYDSCRLNHHFKEKHLYKKKKQWDKWNIWHSWRRQNLTEVKSTIEMWQLFLLTCHSFTAK